MRSFVKTCVAALVISVFAGGAFAQEAPADPSKLLRSAAPTAAGAAHVGGGIGSLNGKATGTAASFTAGWNRYHCYAAQWWRSSTGWQYVYAYNTEGTYFYYGVNSAAASSAQNALLMACQNGHQYSIYITSTTTGAYNTIQIGY